MSESITSIVYQSEYCGYGIHYIFVQGKPWWFAKEVCDLLGYSRMRDALRMLRASQRGSHSARGVFRTIISQSGLYRLILRSNRKEAKEFQAWVEDVLLPQIAETGMYLPNDRDAEIIRLGERRNQIEASKEVNKFIGEQEGKWGVIAYNQGIAVDLSRDGMTPKELREKGRQLGLPSKYRTSGAEVIRHLEPETAMAMCAEKDLIALGNDPEASRQFALEHKPMFLSFHNSRVRLGLSFARNKQLA